MARNISSIPGSTKFRSIISIVLIVCCMAIYLVFIEDLELKADRVARDQVLTSIRGALAMMLYDYTIKGKLAELDKFDRENPFVPLAIYRSLPSNYRGTIKSGREGLEPGWYFDLTERVAFFVSLDELVDEYRMVFDYKDADGNGRFDPRVDGIGGLNLVCVGCQ